MALSSGVSISSVSRDGAGTVTVVTTAAHGLSANQGFSLQNTGQSPFNLNGTVKAVTNSTTFTFAQAGTSLSSNSGTCYPAKQTVILQTQPGRNNVIDYTLLLWLTTQYPMPAAASSAWSGASAQEVAAIAAGTTVEQIITVPIPGALSAAQAKVLVQGYWSAAQAYLAAQTPQPGQYTGITWDGAGWSA